MGYLNNQVITVDAILTKKGRELLAKNDGSFRITQFALADDEIDYTSIQSYPPFRIYILWRSNWKYALTWGISNWNSNYEI